MNTLPTKLSNIRNFPKSEQISDCLNMTFGYKRFIHKKKRLKTSFLDKQQSLDDIYSVYKSIYHFVMVTESKLDRVFLHEGQLLPPEDIEPFPERDFQCYT